MIEEANIVQQEIDELYRNNFGKMVASILYFSPDIDLETAEDLVQDAFTAGLKNWVDDGIPGNPLGWIFTVCRNKALNKIKQQKKTRSLTDNDDFVTTEQEFSESILDDQLLKLVFACAHPDLSPKTQVVITLKYVVNLKVEAIAKILGLTIDGIDKLLVRARQKIRDEQLLFAAPSLPAMKFRLQIVHKIIYLLFNEGYKSSWGKELIREELCGEALLMNKALIDSGIANKETYALHALMLFNAARLKARFGSSGELLELEEQDRSLWNKDLILLGCTFLEKSKNDILSTYHYEASIAFLHCKAPSFNSTNWLSISNLYKQLLQLNQNPFVELSYSIALYYSGQKQTAISILKDLQQKPFLNQYYLLNATLGKISFLEGDFINSKEYYLKTMMQTNSQAEKDLIARMIKKIEDKINIEMQ